MKQMVQFYLNRCCYTSWSKKRR